MFCCLLLFQISTDTLLGTRGNQQHYEQSFPILNGTVIPFVDGSGTMTDPYLKDNRCELLISSPIWFADSPVWFADLFYVSASRRYMLLWERGEYPPKPGVLNPSKLGKTCEKTIRWHTEPPPWNLRPMAH
jgi:hypothetical protein